MEFLLILSFIAFRCAHAIQINAGSASFQFPGDNPPQSGDTQMNPLLKQGPDTFQDQMYASFDLTRQGMQRK